MIRVFFTYILPLLLPSVFYFAWMLPQWRKARAEGLDAPPWTQAPWVKLLAAGFVLTALALWAFGFSDGADPGAQYQPPRFEDGKIIPGGFDDASDRP